MALAQDEKNIKEQEVFFAAHLRGRGIWAEDDNYLNFKKMIHLKIDMPYLPCL